MMASIALVSWIGWVRHPSTRPWKQHATAIEWVAMARFER